MTGFRMFQENFTFTLYHHEAPSPPATRRSLDALRWLIMVMNLDDREYAFAVSVFAYALKNEAVTDKQMWRIDRIYDRVRHAFECSALLCQQATSCHSRRGSAESEAA